jgi:hypothetical protein
MKGMLPNFTRLPGILAFFTMLFRVPLRALMFSLTREAGWLWSFTETGSELDSSVTGDLQQKNSKPSRVPLKNYQLQSSKALFVFWPFPCIFNG